MSTFFRLLKVGLHVSRAQPTHFQAMWACLSHALDAFLFSPHQSPDTQESKDDQALDVACIELLRDHVLPYPNTTPSHFLLSTMVLLNKVGYTFLCNKVFQLPKNLFIQGVCFSRKINNNWYGMAYSLIDRHQESLAYEAVHPHYTPIIELQKCIYAAVSDP